MSQAKGSLGDQRWFSSASHVQGLRDDINYLRQRPSKNCMTKPIVGTVLEVCLYVEQRNRKEQRVRDMNYILTQMDSMTKRLLTGGMEKVNAVGAHGATA
ncbi:hypothetical protein KY289_008118 [Solanum tuberosum]|nr:hypothetical protein KY289_008118 [Solanum tuberosum]